MSKTDKRIRRKIKIRSRIFGTATKPRLAIFRSNKFIYAQAINDEDGVTMAHATSQKSTAKTSKERAEEVGKSIADTLKGKKVDTVIFDRGGFLYSGSVKALADAARDGGLKF